MTARRPRRRALPLGAVALLAAAVSGCAYHVTPEPPPGPPGPIGSPPAFEWTDNLAALNDYLPIVDRTWVGQGPPIITWRYLRAPASTTFRWEYLLGSGTPIGDSDVGGTRPVRVRVLIASPNGKTIISNSWKTGQTLTVETAQGPWYRRLTGMRQGGAVGLLEPGAMLGAPTLRTAYALVQVVEVPQAPPG